MKQSSIIRAYKTIEEVRNQKMPLNASHGFFVVKRALQPHWDFQVEKEQEAMAKYAPTVDEHGNLQFESDEQAQECMAGYQKLLGELADLDVDLGEFRKPVIRITPEVDLSVDDIEALCDFIDFEDA